MDSTTYKTYEIKTVLPGGFAPERQFLDQLQAENISLKQDIERQIQTSKQLEVKARDLVLLTRKLEDLTAKYGDCQARSRSLELDNETLQQRLIANDEELRRLRHIVAEKTPVEQMQEKVKFQEKRIEELLKEIETWKTKYQFVSEGKEREIEELKITINANSQANVEKNVNIMRARYESEMEKMNLEIKRLADLLQSKTLVIEEMRGQEEQIRVLRSYLHERDMEIKDLQSKLAYLSQERDNLILNNKALLEELNSFRDRMGRLTVLERMEEQMKEKIRENEGLHGRIRDLENLLKDLKNFNDKIIEYENKIAMLSSEIERNRFLATQKSKEVEEWREHCEKLESKYNEAMTLEIKLGDAEKALELKFKENEALKVEIMKREDVITELDQRLNQMMDDFNQIEAVKHHLAEAEAEIKRLEDLVAEKVQELDHLREENLKYEHLLKEKSLNEDQAKDYEERITLLIRELDELRSKFLIVETSVYSVTEYEAKTREFEDRIAELTLELDRLNHMIKEKDVIILEWEDRFSDLEGLHRDRMHWEETINEADARYEALKRELEALRQHDTGLEVQNQVYEEKIKDLESEFVRISTEKEKLLMQNRELMERLARLEAMLSEMKIVIEEREHRVRDLEGNLREVQDNLRGRHEEKVKMKGMVDSNNMKMAELIRELEALKGRISLLEDEKQRLLRDNEGLRQEIVIFKKTFPQIQSELDKKNRDFQDLMSKFQKSMSDVDRLTVILQNKDQDLEKKNGMISVMERDLREWQGKYQAADKKVAFLGPEVERLTLILEKKDEEIERLLGIVGRLEKDVKEWSSKYLTLEGRFSNLMQEIERLKAIIAKKDETIQNLENKIAMLSSEFERIKHILEKKEIEIQKNAEELEKWLSQRDNELRGIDSYKKEVEDWKYKWQVSQAELKECREKFQRMEEDYKNKILNLENKIALMSSEFERLKQNLQGKDRDLGYCNGELQRLKGLLADKERSMGEFEGFRREIQEWRQKYERTQSELDDWKRRYMDLEAKIALITGEFERFRVKYAELERVSSGKDQELQKLRGLLSDKEKDTSQFESFRREIQEWRQKYERTQSELDDWKRRYMDLEAKIALITGEFERVKVRITELERIISGKDQELEELRRRLGEASNENRVVKGLMEEIERLKEEVLKWKSMYERQEEDFRQRLIAYENKISLLSGELERLKLMISKKESEIGNQMRASGEWSSKFRTVEEMNENMKRKMDEMVMDLDRFKGRTQELLMIIVILYAEIDRLRMVAQI